MKLIDSDRSSSKDSGDATQRFIKDVSDKTNVAPEIVQGAAFLAELGAEGLAARAMARRSLQGLSRAPAPTAYALEPKRKHGLRQGDTTAVDEGANKQPPGSPPRTGQSKLRDVAEKVRERNLLRNKAQQKAVDRFFSGDGTAETFPSKKGADVRTPKSRIIPDDADDYQPDLDGLYSDGGDSNPGRRIEFAERTGGGAGQPGQARPQAKTIQQQHFSEVLGTDLSKLTASQRRQAIISFLSEEEGVNLRSRSQAEQTKAIQQWINKNKLSDQAVRDRVSKQMTERRFPEQFNQIEARERGGVELPARARNTADRAGRKTRAQKTDGPVNPDRDYVLGKGAKPREGNKLPKNLSVQERIRQRTQTNETNRSDNIPGGRRIKLSRVEYRKRIQEARDRARAKRMAGETLTATDYPRGKLTSQQRKAIKKADASTSIV